MNEQYQRPSILEWPMGRLDFSAGCLVMGILNVTPDSFSDGGAFMDLDLAVEQGIRMAENGAAIIDIGPESTRPGSQPVSRDEQIARAVPVIEKLAKYSDAVLSIDTCDSYVAQAAIQAGAGIINDVTAFADPRMTELAAKTGAVSILMHMKGEPATMQKNPSYDDVVAEVKSYLLTRASSAQSCGIKAESIIIDPGIGFGKKFAHNLVLINELDQLCQSKYRVLVGTSRKKFIGHITGKDIPAERLFGTAATVAASVLAGASIVRVHDVPEMVDVVKVGNAIRLSSID